MPKILPWNFQSIPFIICQLHFSSGHKLFKYIQRPSLRRSSCNLYVQLTDDDLILLLFYMFFCHFGIIIWLSKYIIIFNCQNSFNVIASQKHFSLWSHFKRSVPSVKNHPAVFNIFQKFYKDFRVSRLFFSRLFYA